MREKLKAVADGICSVMTCVPALRCGFGKNERRFTASAQAYAKIPGVWGEYLRRARSAHRRSC